MMMWKVRHYKVKTYKVVVVSIIDNLTDKEIASNTAIDYVIDLPATSKDG